MARDADHVIVLADGQPLAEEGSPAELLARKGWFAEFVNAVEEDANDETGLSEEEEIEEDPSDGDEEGRGRR